MVTLFIGLVVANLLVLCTNFVLGLGAVGADNLPTAVYRYHIALGIGAGLMVTLTHVVVYTYFMGTSKWLQAATDKAGISPGKFAQPGARAKRKAFPLIMTPILVTMVAMFAGAGADPTAGAVWSGQVHLFIAAVAIVVNIGAHLLEFRAIKAQGARMDEALATLNAMPNVRVQVAKG
ncbi:MAG: hypothetical protein GC164_14950 [Phycisphaera sp.]|nr:hypothetical protein [Phycisphaera sp.]